MQKLNVITLLEDLGVEIIIVAVIACAVSVVLRKFKNVSAKVCLFISFAIALTLTFFTETVIFSLSLSESALKAVTSGALAIVLTSFIKKIAFMDKQDIKSGLEKLLSSIVLSDELDKVVNDIVEKLKSETSVDEQSVKDVLKENVKSDLDEATLDMVAKFIIKALSDSVKK